jgi:renal tumor antigen
MKHSSLGPINCKTSQNFAVNGHGHTFSMEKVAAVPPTRMANLGPDFRVIVKLGEGSFAEVFKAKSTHSDDLFAIKRLKKRYRTLDEVNKLPEIASLKALQGHPNIVKLFDVAYDPASGYVAMVFEVLNCNVYELITEHKRAFDEITSLLLAYQLLSAVAFMHSRGLFHRDIKPENCMVNKDTLVLKLVDFGSTRGQSNTSPYTEYVSTRWYRAPECILTSGSYGPEVDEWAVGCMLYELLTAKPLFPGKNELDQIGRIHNMLGTPSRELLQQFKSNPNHQIQFKFVQKVGQDLHKFLPRASMSTLELLKGLLTYNPQDRISAADALQLDCFAPFREAEAAWLQTDQSIPFPVYFFEGPPASPAPVTEPMLTGEVEVIIPPGSPFSPPKVIHKEPVFVPPAPDIVVPVFPKPTFLLPENEPPQAVIRSTPMGPRKAQPVESTAVWSAAPVPPPPKQMGLLTESRVRAAQRIKACQDAIKATKARKPTLFHGAAFPAASTKGLYQRPRPEIVQPRLPRGVL